MIITFKEKKLFRKFNYIKWLNPIELYLEINGYISYINSSINPPNKNFYYKKIKKDSKVLYRAYSPELVIKYQKKLK